jgi:hypothetical protein
VVERQELGLNPAAEPLRCRRLACSRAARLTPHACLPAPARSFGASSDHWRKNLPVLGQGCRAFAIDLLGYGYSDKVWAAPEAVQPGQGRAGGIATHRSPRPWLPRRPCSPTLSFPSPPPAAA